MRPTIFIPQKKKKKKDFYIIWFSENEISWKYHCVKTEYLKFNNQRVPIE